MKKQEYIFGIRPVMETINSGKEVDRVLLQNGLRSPQFSELMKLLSSKKIYYQFVPQEKLNRITQQNHQGVIAYISAIEYCSLEQLIPTLFEKKGTPLLLMLDRITDVRNLGAIARSAECAGADGIIIPYKGAARINADALKTSAGALNYIPVCREHNLKTTIIILKESGFQIVGCTEKAQKRIYECNFRIPTVIILGSEDEGISREYLRLCDETASIPMLGETASLNVSVAAGIVLFEAVRQKLQP